MKAKSAVFLICFCLSIFNIYGEVSIKLIEFGQEFISYYRNPDKVTRYTHLRELFKKAQDNLTDGEYATLLNSCAELAWENTKDTVLVYAMNIEAEHVLPSATTLDNLGVTKKNEFIDKAIKKYRNYEDALMSMLHPAVYIFGTGCVGSYMSYLLGVHYLDKGDYRKAFFYMKQSKDWYNMNKHQVKWTNGMQRPLAIDGYKKAADHLYSKGNIYEVCYTLSDVSVTGKKSRLKFKEFIDESYRNDSLLSYASRDLAIDFILSGDLDYAETYLKKSIDCFETFRNPSRVDIDKKSDTYRTLGDLYRTKGEHDLAEQAYVSAIQCYDDSTKLLPTGYFISCQHLADLYLQSRQILKAAKAIRMCETFMDEELSPYISCLENCGYTPVNTEEAIDMVDFKTQLLKIKYDLAKSWSQEAIDKGLYLGVKMGIDYPQIKGSPLYFELLSYMGEAYFNANKYDKALEKLTAVVSNPSDLAPERILASYKLILQIKSTESDKEGYIQYSNSVYEYLKDYIKEHIVGLTEEYRTKLWSQIVGHITDIQSQTLASCINDIGMIPTSLLNISLLTKGFLLQSSNFIKNAVLNSSSSTLQSTYNMLIEAKDAQASSEYIRNLEKQILKSPGLTKILSKQTEWNSIEYTDIQKNLKTGEIAIEFINYPVTKSIYTQQTILDVYAAILIQKNKNPEIIILGDQSEFSYNFDNNESNLYEKIWSPILKNAGACETVYFSPTGVLNSIPIEYSLPSTAISPDIRRLSSLKNLLNKNKQKKTNHLIAYGGISYDTDIVKASEKASGKEQDIKSKFRGDVGIRAGFSALPYTYDEITSIQNALSGNNNYRVDTITGSSATEESVKALSGQGVNILHIASHGFCWTDKRKLRNFKVNLGELSGEDLAMYGSGLVFAGGNNILKGRKIPDNIDDGILTARELAELDFSEASLIVLSACDTGKGVVSHDGVFGLQRGLKKAGAQSLLLSLQKVPDLETKELMATFYSNLRAGHSISEAFEMGRKNAKKNHPDSNIWYSFILIDNVE